ncbi:MAG: FAD-binding protein [Anaerolineae bacterium]|nr:FAD-binding protein [Anaerolineae bacterium]
MTKRKEIARLLTAITVGGALGAAIMWLLAPRSGKETRAELAGHGLKLIDRVKSARQKQARPADLKRISNWGNYPNVDVQFNEFEDLETLRRLIKQADAVIPRGNGRCYGDSALAPQVISTLRYNKFLAFDDQKGIIQCQSGVLLSEILDVIVPKGWFLPVTPGTKLITVGGAIGSDVHGKSQHKYGNFSDHVIEFDLMLGDGSVITCSKEKDSDLFWTTCGGMGLTGLILNAKLRLIPIETAYIRQESIKARNLDHMMDLYEQSEAWSYSLAWMDCLATGDKLGRGYLMRGEHARLDELEKTAHQREPLILKPARKLNVPFYFPGFVLNKLSMRIFNTLLYLKHPAGTVHSIVDYDTFFYPLDSILNWNRIYGRRGFTQYQFILPKAESRAGFIKILDRIQRSKVPPFLVVLKLYDKQNSYLPFAMKGYSLAVDFPITDNLFGLLDALDQIVLEHGGRVYLTKDVRMKKEMFMQSYPNVERFINNVRGLNHGTKFRSFQSDRVGITQ